MQMFTWYEYAGKDEYSKLRKILSVTGAEERLRRR